MNDDISIANIVIFCDINNIKRKKKNLSHFHFKIIHDHLVELKIIKHTICKSGFIREIIYSILKSLNIR